MKKTLSLALVTAMACLAAVITAAPAAEAAVPSYTGCLNSSSNVIVQVAVGEIPASPPCRPGWPEVHFSGGDLTSLTAGTGLTGGGVNGDVSVALAPSFRLPQTCTPSQGTAWNGTGWACASFASEAAFNSLVALLGSPGTINQGSNPVHWTKLKGVPTGFADGTDDVGPDYSAGFGLDLTGTQFDVDPAQVQRRVAGSCSSGASIRAIAQDGSVTCQGGVGISGYCAHARANPLSFPDAPCRTRSEAIDTAGDVGTYSSIAIGTDGNPVISYLDGTNLDLKVARCNDPLCSGHNETLSTVDSAGIVGSDTSIAIGTDGNPVISYLNHGNQDLRVARCNDAGCTGGNVTLSTVDLTGGRNGSYTSLAIGTDGNPVISYSDGTGDDLNVVHCNDAACTGGGEFLSIVDSGGDVGTFSSIAIGADGNPVISYFDATNGDLKVAHCNDAACAGNNETLTAVDSVGNVGFETSLAIGTDGNPVISYVDFTSYSHYNLKVARCNDPACTDGDETLSIVDPSPTTVGDSSSIAIGTDGNPVISYFDAWLSRVLLARCNDPACAGGDETISQVDYAYPFGAQTSLAVGTDGNPVISHMDLTDHDLTVSRPAISD